MLRRRPFTRHYDATPDVLWHALVAALPSVTRQAASYDSTHRVEWTTDTTGWSYPQSMSVSVDATLDGTAILTMTGTTNYRSAIGDKSRRARLFDTLTSQIAATLEHPLLAEPEPPRPGDQYRWWDGTAWSYDPPEQDA